MAQPNSQSNSKSNGEFKSFSNPKSRAKLYERGFRFVENEAGGKRPREAGWQKKPPRDAESVMGFRDCSVFLSSSAVPSPLICVDIDKLDLLPVQNMVGSLVDAGVLHSRTQGGGYHFYFAHCKIAEQLLAKKKGRKIKIGQNKVGDLLSFHSTFYEPVNCDAPVASFKDHQEVVDIIRGVKATDFAAGADEARLRFLREIDELEGQDGSRNTGLFSAICRLVNPVYLYNISQDYLVEHILTPGLDRYRKINPTDTDFTVQKCLNVIREYEPSKRSQEILTACDSKKGLGEYVYQRLIENCDGKLHVAQAGKVYHWQKYPFPCWVERHLTASIGNVASISGLLGEDYEDIHRLKFGEDPGITKTNRTIEELIKRIKSFHSSNTIEQDFAMPKAGLIQLSTGWVSQFKAGEYKPKLENRPEYNLTHKLNTIGMEEPKRWLAFLREVFPTDTDATIDMLGDLVAAPFVEGVQPLLVMCHGGGSNGKSVLLSTLKYVLGSHAETVSEKLIERVQDNKRQLATRRKLVGKHVGIITESSAPRLDEDFIKALLSGDNIEVGGLNMNSTEVNLRASVFIACNECPRLKTTSRGISRRIVRLPFDATFQGDEVDTMLREKLKAEADGIRKWFYKAVQTLAANNGAIRFTKSSQESTEELIEENTSCLKEALKRWMEPCSEEDAEARGVFTGQYRSKPDKGSAIGNKPKDFPTGLMIAARICEIQNNIKTKTGPKYVNSVMSSLGFKYYIDQKTKTRIWYCQPTEEFKRVLQDEGEPGDLQFLFQRQVARGSGLKIVEGGGPAPNEPNQPNQPEEEEFRF